MWFHPSTARRLAALLEIHPAQVAEAMGNDIAQTWVNNNFAMEGVVHEQEGDSHVDAWGVRWVKRGEFNQIEGFPLTGLPPETVLDYQFPVRALESLMQPMASLIAQRGERFIGVDVSPCVFEMYWRLRGMEDAILDMTLHQDMANTLFGRCADFAVTLSETACERFDVDWLWLGDDVAGQQALIMSPALWRTMIRPHLQRVADAGTRRGLPVAYHCCGALRDIIPDLIDLGIGIPQSGPMQLSRHGPARVETGIWKPTHIHGRRRHARGPAERHPRRSTPRHGTTDRWYDCGRRRVYPCGFAYDSPPKPPTKTFSRCTTWPVSRAKPFSTMPQRSGHG